MATYLSCPASVDDLADAFVDDAISSPKLAPRYAAGVQHQNFGDLLVSNLRIPVGISGNVMTAPSSLGHFVGGICGIVPQEQMPRIDAGRRVALVQDEQRGHFAVFKHPTDAVGADDTAKMSNLAISIAVSTCGPKPAFVRLTLRNLRPEPSGYVHHQRIAPMHRGAN